MKQSEALKQAKIPKLENEFPNFAGDKSNSMTIENWMYLIENNPQFKLDDDKLKTCLATQALRGDALTLVRSYMKTYATFDWIDLKNLLEDRFAIRDDFKIRHSLEVLKNDGNFREFTVKFEQLCRNLSNILT